MKRIRNIIVVVLFVIMISLSAAAIMPVIASAENGTTTINTTTNSLCGSTAYYEYFEDEGRLFILGTGAVTSAPWSEFASSIKYIVISQEITSLPKGCFAGCNNLIELTVPFIGASRSATNKNAILGYFFEETDYYYTDVTGHGTQGAYVYFWFGTAVLYNNDVSVASYNTRSDDYYDRFGTSGSSEYWDAEKAKFAALRYISDVWGFPTSTENNSFVNHKLGNQSGHYYSCYNGERVTYYSTTYYSPTTTYYNIPKSLSTINLTDSTTLSAGALNNCSNIKEVNFFKPKTSFGNYALLNCSATIGEKEYEIIDDTAYSYKINNNNEAEIISILTTLETLSIPEKIGEYKVSTICDMALVGNSTVRQLHIPATITYIGKYAFYNCVNIEEINIPESCTYIDDYAFCNSLSAVSVNISNNVKTVGKYCFSNCTSLQSIVVPETKINFSTGVFSNCTSLKSAIIGSLISEIPDYAFYNCKNLSSIVMGYEVTSIGDYAFYGTALSKATLPDKLTVIGEYAFADCLELTQVKCKGNLEIIGAHSFEGDSKLESINLPNKLIKIGEYAFKECVVLNYVIIPSGVSEIENCTFAYCNALSNITIEGTLKNIGDSAFYYCNLSDFDFSDGLTTIGARAFYKNPLSSIILPDSLKSVGEEAFKYCAQLSSVSIPDDITLSSKALSNNAEELTVTIRNKTRIVGTNILKNNLFKKLIVGEGITIIGDSAFCGCSTMIQVLLPESLKSIGTSSFQGCTGILEITIPNSVKTIGDDSFRNCSSLKMIHLPSSLTSIGDRAFQDCTKLKNITLPQNTNKIGALAFHGALSLDSIFIPDSLASIGEDAFVRNGTYSEITVTVYYNSGVIGDGLFGAQKIDHLVVSDLIHTIGNMSFDSCTQLKSVTLPDSLIRIDSSVFSGCSNLSQISVSDKIAYVGNDAFKNCNNVTLTIRTVDGLIDAEVFNGKLSGITTVNIDNSDIGDAAFKNNGSLTLVNITTENKVYSIQRIGKEAFYGCTLLKNISMPETLTYLGESAFYNCSNLISIVLPIKVSEILDYTFYECSALSSVETHNEIKTVGVYAFYNCSSLSEIVLPNKIQAVESYTFYGCSSLKNLVLPETVSHIGDYAFYNCKALKYLTLPDALTSVGEHAFQSCSSLIELTFGNKVESIGTAALYECTSLSIVRLGTKIIDIPDKMFYACTGLDTLYIYAPISSFGSFSFYGANNVTAYIGNDQYMIDYFDDNAISYVIMDNYEYQYKVIFKNENGDIISSNLYNRGEMPSIPETPLKAPNLIYQYVFSGWDNEVTAVSKNIVYTAVFDEVFIEYTILFKNEDGTILSEETYHYGESIAIPATPIKPKDNTYTYTFSGWDNDVTTCVGNAVHTATYEAKFIDYSVVFYDYDGTVISSDTYHYGETVSVPANPTRNADKIGSYTFEGWDKLVTQTCEGNAEYVATYNVEYTDYTVVFKDYDGDVISTKTYHYGDTIIVPTNPTREADNTYTYAFSGWDKTVTTCEGDATYTAKFAPTNVEYTVVFKNADGTVLSTKTYYYGAEVAIPNTPTKASDNTYTYTFAGWDKEVVDCVSDATYTATYTPVYINYTITFTDYDGRTITTVTYHYGDTIESIANPTRASDETYTYTFNGWDKELGTCKGDAIFKATYTSTYIDYTIIFKNEDGTVLSRNTYHYGDAVAIPATPTKAADNTYAYTFKGWNQEVVNCAGNATYTATYNANYIDYTVTFKNADGTVLSTKTYHYGASVTVPKTPTKAADTTYTYTFKGWDKEVVDCVGNATYTATYDANYINYTVIFKNADGTVLSTNTYHYGDAVIAPEAPTKVADNTYTYTFKAWDKTVVNCAGNATYTATYNATYIDYTVTFKNEDGSILSSDTYHYGESVVAPSTPSKAANNTYTYTFAGWDSEVVACNGNKTYTATYTPVYIEYTVVFKNWNGDVISSNVYTYGQTVTKPSDPTRTADTTYTYAFMGWDKTVTNCTESVVYTATYSSTYIDYEIVFKNYDGSILSSETYHYGDAVVVPETPTKPADESYTYGFAGWDSEVTACLGNKTYMATFNPTNVEYTVVFKDWNGNIISSETYYFGAEVVVPENPTRNADNIYTYTFKNWGKTVAENCVGDAEYTAVYEATYIEYNIKFLDWDGSVIQTVKYHYGDTITAIADPERVSDETYTYTFLSWNKALGTCTGNASFTAQYESTFINYTVVFKDYDGSVISRKTYHFGDSITIPADPVRASDDTYSYTFKDWGNISTSCNGNKEYTANYDAIYIDYTVVFKNHDGSVISTQTYHFGDDVTAPQNPTKTADNTYTYTFAGWDKEIVDCVANATYTASYTPTFIDYTVVFKDSDGSVLSTKTYHYGDAVSAPEAPTKGADDNYTYTFKAWDKEVVACVGDAVYTAVYTSTKIEGNDSTETPTTDNTTDKSDSGENKSDENKVTETDAKSNSGCGGCGSSTALSALAIVAVIGSAIIIKKKED